MNDHKGFITLSNFKGNIIASSHVLTQGNLWARLNEYLERSFEISLKI